MAGMKIDRGFPWFVFGLVGLVICGFSVWEAADYHSQLGDLEGLQPLTEEQLEDLDLEVGQSVWLGGRVDPDNPVLAFSLVHGCVQDKKGSTSNNRTWESSETFSQPFTLLLGATDVTVVLEEGCPHPDGVGYLGRKDGQPYRRWNGYRLDQELSIVGVVESREPLVVAATSHFGGSPESHEGTLRSERSTLLGSGLVTLLFGLAILFWGPHFRKDRWGWRDFAELKELRWSQTRLRGHRIEGKIDSREVSIYRRRCVGDFKLWGATGHLDIYLSAAMPMFSSLDQVTDDEVRKGLEKLARHGFSAELRAGWLALSWPGFRTSTLAEGLDPGLKVAEHIIKAARAGWHKAMYAIDGNMGNSFIGWTDSRETWKLKSAETRAAHSLDPRPVVLFEYDEGRCQTTLTAPVLPWDDHWVIEPLDPSRPGMRTGDPVLDSQISFHGFDPETLRRLLQEEELTPLLLAIFCGYGARLEKGDRWGVLPEEGELRLVHPELIFDPTELYRDVERLQALLSQLKQSEEG